ncbi:MAG: hypothetical protein ACLRPS_12640 [Paraprevotella clara]|uniref:Uncharacterized protein n=1 Tax=Paraprevotella clara TaxID=454154 RepID=A0A6N2YI81_9BACT
MRTMALNFRQMARLAGLAICTVSVRGILWVAGILWSIIRDIVNGVYRMVIGVTVFILSVIAFFGFILWLFTL